MKNKLEHIEILLNELHNDLAKSILDMKTYSPLSKQLLEIKENLNEVKTQEIQQLLEWKESASKVMNNIDLQKVGKLIGVPLGADVSTEIIPFIEKSISQRDTLTDLLSDAVDLVSNLPYDESLQETKGNFVMNAQSVIYDIKGNAPDLLNTK